MEWSKTGRRPVAERDVALSICSFDPVITEAHPNGSAGVLITNNNLFANKYTRSTLT